MLSWLAANLGSIVVALVLCCIVGFIVRGMVRDKKQGKSSCSHGCSNCGMCGSCYPHAETK